MTVSSLILLHPSLAQSERALEAALGGKPAGSSRQMLDRVQDGTAELLVDMYESVYLEPSNTHITGDIFDKIFRSLRNGGTLHGCAQEQMLDAIAAGFLLDGGVWKKPEVSVSVSGTGSAAAVSLKRSLGSKANKFGVAKAAERKIVIADELNDFADDLIDEDSLIEESQLLAAIKIPEKCRPDTGRKRRKPCKDCTCGLKELEEQAAEKARARQAVVLAVDDTAEIDFTQPGKSGSCGSCALGDAFRCDGCPYLGLPPFKPGETISISIGDDL
ncbi:hypothetical protein CANCADRAFT_4417 [Tortispora caseinolytica NRRL Y-17796]|uniref:Uncharacterized protein n=1 Tax=Tortispora caseinolytica NRRL Y-17796 TaxID=767744 RepID=A0A1E4TDF5_9ASCO|nr:hypothetical protein CANCADRAFT_4417 [Tortispora caseinolytica NRRL Y-17796]